MTETQLRRFDPIAWVILAVIAAIAIYAAIGTYVGQHDRIADNTRNAVVNCENANESREASRALWGYVLDLSQAGNPNPTDAERAFIVEFRVYVNKVYQPHDCNDLSKKYPLPPPPVIPAGTS